MKDRQLPGSSPQHDPPSEFSKKGPQTAKREAELATQMREQKEDDTSERQGFAEKDKEIAALKVQIQAFRNNGTPGGMVAPFRRAIRALLVVNSNLPGGGGTEFFNTRLKAVRA